MEQRHSEEIDQETVETSANTNISNTNDGESAGTVSSEQNSFNLNNTVYCLPQTDQNCQCLCYLNFVMMLLSGEPFGVALTVL